MSTGEHERASDQPDELLDGPPLGEPSKEPKPHGDPAGRLPTAASDETMGAVPAPKDERPADA